MTPHNGGKKIQLSGGNPGEAKSLGAGLEEGRERGSLFPLNVGLIGRTSELE